MAIGSKINIKLQSRFKRWIYGDAYSFMLKDKLPVGKSFVQYLFKQKRIENEVLLITIFFVQFTLILIAIMMIPYVGTIIINGNIISLDIVLSELNGLYILLIASVLSFVDAPLYKITNSKQSAMIAIIASPIIMIVCMFAMLYEYGTFSLHEIVQFQNTKASFGINRSGLLINPAVGLIYLSSLCFWIKSSKAQGAGQGQYYKLLDILFSVKKFLFIMIAVFYLLGGYGPIYSLNLISREYIVLNILMDSISVFIKYLLLDLVLAIVLSGIARRSEGIYYKELKMIILPATFIMMFGVIFIKFMRS
jgi:hypothetical protein